MEPRPTDAGKPWLAESAGKWLSEAANEANTRITKLVDGAGAPAPTRPVPPVAAAAAVAATYSDTAPAAASAPAASAGRATPASTWDACARASTWDELNTHLKATRSTDQVCAAPCGSQRMHLSLLVPQIRFCAASLASANLPQTRQAISFLDISCMRPKSSQAHMSAASTALSSRSRAVSQC